jgi:xanthine dehydrogenase accessory factor
MMSNSILELAYQLTREGEPFVLATVVWCEAPTSAKPGAQALIRANGEITGWIGGSCAQPVVLREAARLLREGGDPYLLRLGTSETSITQSGVRTFPMSCTSGGVLDIYMEPHLHQPQLILIGDSPVIAALSSLAPVINFAVNQLNQADLGHVKINEQTYILVATHGQYDEDALDQALRSPACYVGMVGSRKRAEACRAYLRSSGLTDAQMARLRVPAGLDVGAVTPEEIAASILAELVQARRRGAIVEEGNDQFSTREQAEESAIDPVCGMLVEITGARHHSVLDGRDFYFCCAACKRQFERNPQEYLVQPDK